MRNIRRIVIAACAAAAMLIPTAAHAAPYSDAFTQQAAFPDATSPSGTTANATADKATGDLSVTVAARSALPAGAVVPYVNVGVGGATAVANGVIVHRIPKAAGTYTATVTTSLTSKRATAAATGTVVPYVTAAGAGASLYAVYQAYQCSTSYGSTYCYGTGAYDSTYVPLVCAPVACADPGSTVVMSKPVTVPAGADGVQVVVYMSGSANTQGEAEASASAVGTVTGITAV